ncbi:MAG: type II toxin-antitoxin system prevent-host-death family antitoxin [Tepidiformaceae bacterium]
MRSIGIRELRQNASEYLRLVQAGESVEVTDRGRPVALLVPVPEDPMDRLIRLGIVRPPQDEGSILDIEPLPADPCGTPTLSDLIERDRDDRL